MEPTEFPKYLHKENDPVFSSGSRKPVVGASRPSGGSGGSWSSQRRIPVTPQGGHPPRSSIGIFSSALLFFAGLLVSFVWAGVDLQRIIIQLGNKLEHAVEPQPSPTPVVPIAQPDGAPAGRKFVQPLFGPIAIEQCQERCQVRSGPARQSCRSGCNYLRLTTYGRRITLQPLDPLRDANSIIKQCLVDPLALQSYPTRDQWRAEISGLMRKFEAAAAASPKDVGTARLEHSSMMEASNSLSLPPAATKPEREITEELVRTACLRSHVGLAQLALLTAQQNSDSYSERFFSQLHRKLRATTLDKEATVLSEVKRMKLASVDRERRDV